ncbi:HalOD1 output domain-containing protein [Natrinema gelatinilyticum]|uniref:HalOD1 output domain-containing protein n=1 Tax=Natrinema gelatinilyticum TaxID=2961571 RepID=UPI0020C299FF|nr:HalOD1 output domain-containing protein [Natrinema gelatinilyticum]
MAELPGESNVSEQTSIIWKIVKRIAELEGVSPTDLGPLHTVDPEALEQLFQPISRSERAWGQVVFDYCGYRITVHANDDIEVTPTDDIEVTQTDD